jgi:hypothetical protein
VSGLNPAQQRGAVTATRDVHHSGASAGCERLRSIRAAAVGDDDFALFFRGLLDTAWPSGRRSDRLRLVQTHRHFHALDSAHGNSPKRPDKSPQRRCEFAGLSMAVQVRRDRMLESRNGRFACRRGVRQFIDSANMRSGWRTHTRDITSRNCANERGGPTVRGGRLCRYVSRRVQPARASRDAPLRSRRLASHNCPFTTLIVGAWRDIEIAQRVSVIV